MTRVRSLYIPYLYENEYTQFNNVALRINDNRDQQRFFIKVSIDAYPTGSWQSKVVPSNLLACLDPFYFGLFNIHSLDPNMAPTFI